MNRKIQFIMMAAVSTAACTQKPAMEKLPNIVYILADDLGYGDLSCYGQTKFSTPNIDAIASQGMQFLQHYSGTTVCAPSRSCLMTGMHNGHSFIRGNKSVKAVNSEGQYPLADSVITIAEVLKDKGYVSGAFGKWGLGFTSNEGDPLKQGFDEFYGFYCQGLAHNYYPYYLWHNNQKIMLPENEGSKAGSYAPDLMHKMALEFIETNKDKPFFLYYPTIIPHAELFAKEEYMQKYRGKFLPEVSYASKDSATRYRKGSYGSQPESHAAFAALINQLDDYVGEILAKLEELGLEDNTIIIFASDNGPHLEGGADPDYFNSNGPLKGYKRDLYEGGIRTPMLVRWPGVVTPGSKTSHISAFWDIMPTLADITDTNPPKSIDGISFLPTLIGKGEQPQHKYLYWEFHEQGGKRAVRAGNWKAIQRNIDNETQLEIELYDLSTDIGEENNIAASYPEKVAEMEEIFKNARTTSLLFPLKIDKTGE